MTNCPVPQKLKFTVTAKVYPTLIFISGSLLFFAVFPPLYPAWLPEPEAVPALWAKVLLINVGTSCPSLASNLM